MQQPSLPGVLLQGVLQQGMHLLLLSGTGSRARLGGAWALLL